MLGEILDELLVIDGRITKGKEAFFADDNLRDAISMRLITLSALLIALSDSFTEEYPELPIARVRGLRNIRAHAYGNVDFERLWKNTEEDYPALCDQLRRVALARNVQ